MAVTLTFFITKKIRKQEALLQRTRKVKKLMIPQMILVTMATHCFSPAQQQPLGRQYRRNVRGLKHEILVRGW